MGRFDIDAHSDGCSTACCALGFIQMIRLCLEMCFQVLERPGFRTRCRLRVALGAEEELTSVVSDRRLGG